MLLKIPQVSSLSWIACHPDTLKFVIGATENDKCCSGVTTIESVTLNGVALPNGREDLNIAIYK
ncbi:MAG: hypothetical protein IPN76_18975 [Saprospiraceae bacterium]|nr:hypothetical protein [Saprospiraceae bacterium]